MAENSPVRGAMVIKPWGYGVWELIQGELDRVNERYAQVEKIKKFALLEHDLSQETGELTPTLKVKRNVVYRSYADEFTRLYDGG